MVVIEHYDLGGSLAVEKLSNGRIGMGMRNEQLLQNICEEFHESAPVGTPCTYYPTKPFRHDKALKTCIRSAPWIMGGSQIVVMVEGKSGGVAIEHIVFEP